MKSWRIKGPCRLEGSVTVPGDKSIGQRAVLLSAIASGRSTLRGLSGGLDNAAAIGTIEALGVRVSPGPEGGEGRSLVVEGVGLDGLSAPAVDLDAGNSGTTMRLAAGLLAGQRFGWRIVGDESLGRRPMRRVTEPLRAMGARVHGTIRGDDEVPPIESEGVDRALDGLSFESPVASAQVKSAILLAGLYAQGKTIVAEPSLSRDHTELLLASMGAPIKREGTVTLLDTAGWDRRLTPVDIQVPGDLSSAAFLLAGALVTGSGPVEVRGVGLNPTRLGFIEILDTLLIDIQVERMRPAGAELVGDVSCAGRTYASVVLSGRDQVVRSIDEFPILAVLGARSPGLCILRDARELRVKESDRIAAMATVLRSFGCRVEEVEDGLTIAGRKKVNPARVSSKGDHRIAMSAAILALAAEGESTIEDVECVDTSYPGFLDTLAGLGADVEEVEDA